MNISLKKIASFTLFSLFLLILYIPHSAEIAFTILSFAGIYITIKYGFIIHHNQEIRQYALLVWAFFLVTAITIINTEDFYYGIHKLGTNSHYLFAPFLAVMLFNVDLKKIVPIAIKMGTITAGIYAFYQHHELGITRAHGTLNPIIFGGIMTIMAFISISNLPKDNVKEKILSIIAFIIGLYASYLSGSRGAWLTIPAISLSLLFIWYKLNLLGKEAIIFLVILTIIIAGLYAFDHKLTNRVNSTIKQLKSQPLSTNTSLINTPFGIRLTMWHHGITLFKERPFLGHGLQNTTQLVAKDIYLTEKNLYKKFLKYDHLHNEYINTLVGKGILGMTMLFIMLILPVIIFWRKLSIRQSSSQTYFCTIGIITITGYIIIGLTNTISTHPILNIFFLTILAVSFIGSANNPSR